MNQPYPQDAPVIADAPEQPQRGATGRALAGAGIALALVAVVFGALFLTDLMMSETSTSHRSYAAADTVELVADGDVTVVAAEGDVEVDAIAHSGLRKPTYSADESASRLELTHRCGWFIGLPRCSGELDVTLPADTEVVIRTENGDIVASGLAGDLSMDTSNGDVETTGLTGPVTARSSNGDIDITDSLADVDASTSNGEITVVDVDGSVTTDSSNGEITIGSVTGDASADSSNGSVEISAVDGDVHGVTSNGEVTVVGDGEPVALTISTSNGDQTIDGATDPDAERTVEIRSSNGDVTYRGK